MAEKNEAQKDNKPTESVYTVSECAQNYKLFGASYEVVSVALKLAGKDTVTFAEAKKIVDNFKQRKPGK